MSTAANVLAGVLGLLFLVAGGSKVAGMRRQRDGFRQFRYPDWFLMFTGVWEMAGAALLLVGIPFHGVGLAGAALIVAAMLGAVYTHLVRVPEPKLVAPPAALLAAAAAATVLLAANL
jgi:putative oxidoreductase